MNAIHEDAGMFRDALALTRDRTGFAERLIEKDYFCTLLLAHLAAADAGLVFKGGTCLAKVYANFYRLSEDLDFVIPMPEDAPRARRSRAAEGLNKAAVAIPDRLRVFRLIEPPRGANRSTQYIATVGYTSLSGTGEGTIKIEVGLRESLRLPAATGSARTLLLDPVSRETLLKPVSLRCIARPEAFAEKFRAALTRREPAVRDFFDIDYAVRNLGLEPREAGLISLVRQKLAVPGNDPADVSEARLAALRRQVDPQLRPVLRAADFTAFDLERAFRVVKAMARAAGEPG